MRVMAYALVYLGIYSALDGAHVGAFVRCVQGANFGFPGMATVVVGDDVCAVTEQSHTTIRCVRHFQQGRRGDIGLSRAFGAWRDTAFPLDMRAFQQVVRAAMLPGPRPCCTPFLSPVSSTNPRDASCILTDSTV
jgi:hypothetical protein